MSWTLVLAKSLTYVESMVPQLHAVEVERGRLLRRHLRTGGRIGADILAHVKWSAGAPFQTENLFFRGLASRARSVRSHHGLVEHMDFEAAGWPTSARVISLARWLMDSVRRLQRILGLG